MTATYLPLVVYEGPDGRIPHIYLQRGVALRYIDREESCGCVVFLVGSVVG